MKHFDDLRILSKNMSHTVLSQASGDWGKSQTKYSVFTAWFEMPINLQTVYKI